jgi:hypothetical protein
MKKNIFFVLLLLGAIEQSIHGSILNVSELERTMPLSKEQIVEYMKKTDNYRSIETRYPALLATWENIRFQNFWYDVDDEVITNVINQLLLEYYPTSKNKLNGEALKQIKKSDITRLKRCLAEGPYAIYVE